ncbi:hypothetical protein C8R43DRAFT_949280 [Mycena crocata]|nr:hypothetical protein C8R43DRAFT_949280 [Mycena crocata]
MSDPTSRNRSCTCEPNSDGSTCQTDNRGSAKRNGRILTSRLAKLSPMELFFLGSSTKSEYRIVSAYIHEQGTVSTEKSHGEGSGALKCIPNELLFAIAALLPLRDRTRFGGTSRLHHSIANRILLTAAALSIRPYNLSIVDMQFLQTCTGIIVAGSVLNAVLNHHEPGERSKAPPPSLDLYCGTLHGQDVANFLHHATGFSHVEYNGDLDILHGIRRAYSLAADTLRINVFETYSSHPMETVLSLPTSADIGAWSVDQFWHGYPRSTADKLAMSSPGRLPVHTVGARQRTWDTLQRIFKEGFTIESEYPRSHTCASNINCPAAWRTSLDSGCLRIRLPIIPLLAQQNETTREEIPGFSWTLGAVKLCTSHSINEKSKYRSFRHSEIANCVYGDNRKEITKELPNPTDSTERTRTRLGRGLETYLRQMTPKRLFAESLVSETNHRTISTFLQEQVSTEFESEPGIRTGLFSRFPVEIITMILLRLTMRDRMSFGATCRAHRSITSWALLTAAAHCLKPYNLSLVDLRFLQCCTKTFVSGSPLRRLLFTGNKSESSPENDTIPAPERPTLDLYCPENEGLVVATFIAHATGYTLGPYIGTLDDNDGVQDAHTLTKDGAPNINVFEAWSENPLDAILQLSTTADMNAWMLDRIWIGYPDTTFSGFAITTPPRLSLGDPDNEDMQRRAWDIIHAHMRDGFWIDSELPCEHRCGEHPNCPITWRSTGDRAHATLKFPTLPYSAPASNIWKRIANVSWTMGASARCRNVRTDISQQPRSYKFHEYNIWKDEFHTIIDTRERPE